MDTETLNKRIRETKYDPYPLERMLPQFTAYNFFIRGYDAVERKSSFLDNHKYLKLREGYYSLFACKAFDEIEDKGKHYIIFTPEDMGDVGFMSDMGSGQVGFIQYDVKEYHLADKKDFFAYLISVGRKQKVLNNQYGLIIALNRDVQIDEDSQKEIKELSKILTRGIFICSADRDAEQDLNKGTVTFFYKGDVTYQKVVTIGNPEKKEDLIYQDDILSKIKIEIALFNT